MADADRARREPTATVELVWDAGEPYVRNRAFDPRLIAYDDSYCTTLVDLDQVQQLPTATYFASRVRPHLPRGARVIDIGCGRGEFVEHLRSTGLDALGYDPILPGPEAHLRDRCWTPDDESADLFVMRCVLPHIPQPWTFVAEMGDANPDSLLLVEFQRREWIVEAGFWYQIPTTT